MRLPPPGQFLHQSAQVIDSPSVDMQNGRYAAQLHMWGPHSSHRTVAAHLGQRRNMQHETHVPCWHVRNNGHGLIKGTHTDYVVTSLGHRASALNHIKFAKKMFLNSYADPNDV